MSIAGVIFDFDGVIVNSIELHLEAWNKACVKVLSKRLENPNRLIGMSTRKIAFLLSSESHQPELADYLISEKQSIITMNKHPIPLLPGANEAFLFLMEQKIPFGICSNAPKKFILNILENNNLSCAIVNGIEATSHPKPSPIPYLKTAKDLGLSDKQKKSIIVFEDSLHGMKAAIDAGMRGIGVTTQNTSSELIGVGATSAVKSLQEALDRGFLLNNISGL